MGAEPAAPGAKGAHARRLYLAAFWPLLAIAVGVPVQQGLL